MGVAKNVDAVIIGGGLSGLAAALTLKDAGKALVLLEAKNRLGGRARTEHAPFGPVDVGAEYIGPAQRHVSHFVERFGVPTFATSLPSDMKWVYQDRDGKVRTLRFDELPGEEATFQALGALDELAFRVRPYVDRPETLPASLKRLDDDTIAEWQLSKDMGDETRDAFYASLRAVLSIEPTETSPLFLLHYAATAGGYSSLIEASGTGSGAQDVRFVNGTVDLVNGFASAVGSDAIVLGDGVRCVRSGEKSVEVETVSRQLYRADHVIVALGPWAFNARAHRDPITMSFESKPKQDYLAREMLCNGMHHGMSLKGFVRFTTNFWTQAGLSGRSLCANPASPISWTMDNSPPLMDAAVGSPARQHSLMVFMAGKKAHDIVELSSSEREPIVLEELEKLFGSKVKSEFLEYFDLPMPGPAGVLLPGVLSSVGTALRRPVGRVHWASSESALDWSGYMDGAIQSGIRAATELL